MSDPEPSPLAQQLAAAGVLDLITARVWADGCLRGRTDLRLVVQLRQARAQFAEGALHGLHADVGPDRIDFRSYTGTFGRGSLQVVVSLQTGQVYADLDQHNPYQDVVGSVGHAGVVVWHALQRVGRWLRGPRRKD